MTVSHCEGGPVTATVHIGVVHARKYMHAYSMWVIMKVGL
jgi:hypothetical protein